MAEVAEMDVEQGFCHAREDRTHCDHWWECAPCCACGHVGTAGDCDCPKHNPSLYDADGNLLPESGGSND